MDIDYARLVEDTKSTSDYIIHSLKVFVWHKKARRKKLM